MSMRAEAPRSVPESAGKPRSKRERAAHVEDLSQEARLRSLLKILREINQARDLRSLLTMLTSETTTTLGVERSTIFLYDPARKELWSFVAEGISDQIWFDAKKGMAGHVFESRKSLIVNDVTNDPHFNPAIDRKTGFVTRSALTVPIINTRGETVGVFQAVNKIGGEFDAVDAEFLEAVAGEAAVTIENVRLYELRRRMFESLVTALADSIEARDPLTAGHSVSVMRYAKGIAAAMDLPPDIQRAVEYAALLHDYGKIGVPDDVLRKPGPLDAHETDLMRSHVEHTARILSAIEFEEGLRMVPQFAAEHHERLDGHGYPAGLKIPQITLGGRIIAVADVFEALTSRRHYRQPMTPENAFMALTAESGKSFDSGVVEALARHLAKEGILTEDFSQAALRGIRGQS
jgi:HD-GYP domain-containing protein (c-di-GMP phosphodiesterase class II)